MYEQVTAIEQQMYHQKGQGALLRGLRQGVFSTVLRKHNLQESS